VDVSVLEPDRPNPRVPREGAPLSTWIAAALVFLAVVGALVTYKASGSLATIAKAQAAHTLAPRADAVATPGVARPLRPLIRTVNYLAIVWPALVFGVLIGAAVRALIPARWVGRFLGRSGLRSHLIGGLAGAPLMLCSCCVAPVFAAVHERTQQAGPTAALMLASPSLNPAALALTFLLFPLHLALARLALAIVLVFGVSSLAARYVRGSGGRVAACSLETAPPHGVGGVLGVFAREAWRMARSTLPIIVLGVILSSFLLEFVPFAVLGTMPLQIGVVALVALVSVPLALPTFAEIPLALGLLAAGAPAGAAVALLVAGPAINLPSLLTVSRMTTPRYALALAIGTFAVAVAGGLLVQSI
jgi:uncharacterized membrane protein YraQ (UPF0718 family)